MTAGRSDPTTFELIESVALHHPERPAFVDGHRATLTYRQLHFDLIRTTRALDGLGVRRGQRVAVSRPSWQIELMLLIACENLGAVSCSFDARPGRDADAQAIFGQVDWVLSEVAAEPPAPARFQRIDAEFLRSLARIQPDDGVPYPRCALEPHEPQRITRTSGSTGRAKLMVLTRKAQEYWIRRAGDTAGYDADTRLVVAGPMRINVAYARTCACLRAGGTVLDLTGEELPAHDVTHVWGLPALFESLLDSLPPGYKSPRPVAVGTGGGAMTVRLRQRALDVFGGEITNRYGGNETGWICDDLDASGEGWLSPGVDVRIVDQEGRDVPAGESGMIVVRAPGMVDGYLNEPEAGTRAFRDGWFHTGDWGALVQPRRLRLSGRFDDLINLGGIKKPAAQIEDDMRRLPQIRDCAALAIHQESSGATVGVALVAQEGVDRDALARHIQKVFTGKMRTQAAVIFLDELPRLANGKLDRTRILLKFARQGAPS